MEIKQKTLKIIKMMKKKNDIEENTINENKKEQYYFSFYLQNIQVFAYILLMHQNFEININS